MRRLNVILTAVVFSILTSGISNAALTGQWQFEGNANDSIGSNDGTMHGGEFTQGLRGSGALLLDGVDDYVSLADYAVTGTEFTITVWANHYGPGGGDYQRNSIFLQNDDTATGGNGQSIIGLHTYVIPYDNPSLESSRADIRSISQNDGGVFQKLHAGYEPWNEWHHYAMTVGEDYLTLYIDGVLVGQEANLQTGDYTTSVDYVDIGRNRWNSENRGFFNGAIDDLRIYDEALSQTQINNEVIPEPATILLLGAGGLLLRKRG